MFETRPVIHWETGGDFCMERFILRRYKRKQIAYFWGCIMDGKHWHMWKADYKILCTSSKEFLCRGPFGQQIFLSYS